MSGSDALQTAINIFFQQLQICIKEKRADQQYLTMVIFSSAHLNPLQVLENGELGISLVADILNSGYQERGRYQMASEAMQLLGKWFKSVPFLVVHHHWIPTLLGFLSLCEKFYLTESLPHPGSITLCMLFDSPSYSGFCEMVFPILTSILLPTHPLQSRSLALGVFNRFRNEWFSSQMENILYKDLSGLLQAVGDPFQFPNLPLWDGQPMVMAGYEPMMTVILLIEFASSDLWQNHLCHSNFTSCEEIMSTGEGRRAALKCMWDLITHSRSELLRTPVKMIVAIERLVELKCFNTAEVVILWTWTAGVVNPLDSDAWNLIGSSTSDFYDAHPLRPLTTLSQHITDTTMEAIHIRVLSERYGHIPHWVQQPPVLAIWPMDSTALRISQACQLRRLYHLFKCNPTPWRKVVVAEGVKVGFGAAEETARLSRYPVIFDQFMDLVCDYP